MLKTVNARGIKSIHRNHPSSTWHAYSWHNRKGSYENVYRGIQMDRQTKETHKGGGLRFFVMNDVSNIVESIDNEIMGKSRSQCTNSNNKN